MQHECLKELQIEEMGKDITEIKDIVTGIAESLNGNGKPGIKTRMALVEDGLRRSWWFLGGVGVAILGLLAGVVVK